MSVIGSTVHVKMATTLIGSSNRVMSAAFIPTGQISFVGTEFLYESTGALDNGRLTGLRLGTAGTVNLSGCVFRDAGGSGGTSRSDLLVGSSGGVQQLHLAGTRVTSLSVLTGAAVPANFVKALAT